MQAELEFIKAHHLIEIPIHFGIIPLRVCVCLVSLYIHIFLDAREMQYIYYIYIYYIHTPLLFCLIWTHSCASFGGFADARY